MLQCENNWTIAQRLKECISPLFAISLLTSCIGTGEKIEVLDTEPVSGYFALCGYGRELKDGLFVVPGNINKVWDKAGNLALELGIGGVVEQEVEFTVNEPLSFVVIRSVLPIPRYGFDIERVERRENSFFLHAVHTNPAPGSIPFTVPTHLITIIPAGQLPAGEYSLSLRVTTVNETETGTRKIGKNPELSFLEFKVSKD